MPSYGLWVLGIIAGGVLVASAVSVVAYFVDKRAAVKGTRRVRERTLHLLALAGGWPGAMAGQRLFRHKTRDQPFRMIFWCTVAGHVAVVAAVVWLLFQIPSS